ncbi:proton-associated sugar transporter A isoform X4 [Drosophila obscura]|uniref:proton-associated sugar transporter A isoform X4 n=1 Tax=Drosophila obscura TaxID=7282 RepID=UPI001BB24896|nr:proton-associated sugar transporter A isoform X4 [Drosophila obscura]
MKIRLIYYKELNKPLWGSLKETQVPIRITHTYSVRQRKKQPQPNRATYPAYYGTRMTTSHPTAAGPKPLFIEDYKARQPGAQQALARKSIEEGRLTTIPSTTKLTTATTADHISTLKDTDETSFTEIPDQSREKIEVENVQQTQNSVQIESLSHYLLSIIYMPYSLRMVCLTNLFCWMAHVCYSLYFTDFVGEAIFNGDPKATEGSNPQIRYEEGIRFGCWGMAMYSLSCACYSLVIDKLIQRFRAKIVYIGGLCFYCTGMALMALTRAKISVILFSWTAGVMYSTLFTMPYLLVAHYHYLSTFELDENGQAKHGSGVRGLGTDIAIISSMVFLAQFILSMCMGTIIKLSGTTTAVIYTASFLSLCGALSATKIMYLDL